MQIEESRQPSTEVPSNGAQGVASASRVGYGLHGRQRKSFWQRLWRLLIAGAVLATFTLSVRTIAANFGTGETLRVNVDNEQPIIIDTHSGLPRSPYVFGVNVFPAGGTQAFDGAPGFMPYDADTVAGLKSAGITMLRFPGGTWGQEHTLSYAQINKFLALAQQIHAAPLIEIRLSNSSPQQAAALVSYTNNPHDPNRKTFPDAPFVPVRYWAIGNEPDLRGPSYTVSDYVRDFISFATVMKTADPSIQIFGPEISQYTGPMSAPIDSTGTPWLKGFLQGVAAYEHAHNNWQILDGVSVHRYPFGTSTSMSSTSFFFASADEWRYALPPLQDEILHIMGSDVPVAITEINTSVLGGQLASQLATALWWADTLGTLLEGRVGYVDFFAAQGLDEPQMLINQHGQQTPLARVMELYTHMATNVVLVGSSGGLVSVYAATSTSHDTVTLMFVNKTPNHRGITIEPLQQFSAWHASNIDVPPYALAAIILHRGASGQIFLYAPSPTELAQGQPGTISVRQLP